MTFENVCDRKAMMLLRGLTAARHIYGERGYDISKMFMDNDFNPLALGTNGVKINQNNTATDYYVPAVKHQIRNVKERTHSVWNTLTFDRMPHVMIVKLIHQVLMWLHDFPFTNGLSTTYSPRTIMNGTTLD